MKYRAAWKNTLIELKNNNTTDKQTKSQFQEVLDFLNFVLQFKGKNKQTNKSKTKHMKDNFKVLNIPKRHHTVESKHSLPSVNFTCHMQNKVLTSKANKIK